MDLASVDGLLTTTRSVHKSLDLTRPLTTWQAPITGNSRDRRRLAIADIDRCVGALLPAACTIGTNFRRAARPPAETVTFWDSRQQR